MVKEIKINNAVANYKKIGIIAGAVVLVAVLGGLTISAFSHKEAPAEEVVVEEVATTEKTTNPNGELRIAIVSMDKIITDSKVLKDLQKQRTKYQDKLRKELEKTQKELEKEKADIEKSQDLLSQDALQRRVIDLQRRANEAQRALAEKAQAIEMSYQDAFSTVEKKYFDNVVEDIIKKQKISLVLNASVTRIGTGAGVTDITKDVIKALDKKVSSIKMEKPKGF